MCCVGMSVPCVACERVVGAGAVCMYAVCAGLCCCIRDVFLFSSLGCLMWFFLRGGGAIWGGDYLSHGHSPGCRFWWTGGG